MFGSFWEDIDNNFSEEQKINVNIEDNLVLNRDALFSKLKDIDNISEKDLYEIIKSSYSSILDSIIVHKDQKYIDITMSAKFIMVLTQVVGSVELKYIETVSCNKLVYDYITLESALQEEHMLQLFTTLSKVVNRKYIPVLTGCGIPEKIASYIVLARFSSPNEFANVKRMNFVILTSPISIMTEQTIVNIYQTLFDKVTMLFEATMLDVINPDEDWVTPEINELYGVISLAILDILESMPSKNIIRVLRSYQADYSMKHKGEPRRFNMNTISGDYSRILEIMEYLEKKEFIYVP